jgi:hypothetical protein
LTKINTLLTKESTEHKKKNTVLMKVNRLLANIITLQTQKFIDSVAQW